MYIVNHWSQSNESRFLMMRHGQRRQTGRATEPRTDRSTELNIESSACQLMSLCCCCFSGWMIWERTPFEPFLVTRTYRVFSWEFVCYAEMCIVNAGATLIIIIRYVERLLSDSSSLSRRLLWCCMLMLIYCIWRPVYYAHILHPAMSSATILDAMLYLHVLDSELRPGLVIAWSE